jgi:ribosomal protein S27E
MYSSQNKNPPCRSCNALLLGSDGGMQLSPHEYLIAAGARSAAGSTLYSCLVCSSTLLQSREDNRSSWSPGDQGSARV